MCQNKNGFSAPHEEKFVLDFKVSLKLYKNLRIQNPVNFDINKEKNYFPELSQSVRLQMTVPVLQAPPL